MKKKKVKIEQDGALGLLIKRITQPISDAIYALRVKLHAKLHKNKKPTSGQRKKVGEMIFYWVVLAFPLFQFAIMYVYVNFNSILMAFQAYIPQKDGSLLIVPVGLDNFRAVIDNLFNPLRTDGLTLNHFSNSLILYGLSVVITLPLSVLFSYYIYKNYVGAGAFRVLLMMPSILSGVVFALIFKIIGDTVFPQLGLDPLFTGRGGLELLMVLFFFNLFVGFGSSVLMYSNAMSRIPDSLVEYAQLEGCTPLKEFLSITLPLAYPTIETFLIIGIAAIFTNEGNAYTFYSESAPDDIRTVGYYLFTIIRHAKTRSDHNEAAAAGLLLTAVTIPIVMISRFFLDKLDKGAEF